MSYIDKIAKDDLLKLVNAMVDSFDLNGYFFKDAKEFINDILGNNNGITLIVNEFLLKEFGPMKDDPDDITYWINEPLQYKKIISELSIIARQKIKERISLRKEKGEIVCFQECNTTFEYLDKIVFYKDGGWGLADKNGSVIIKNEYKKKFSECEQSIFCKGLKRTIWIVQNVDTELWGAVDVSSLNMYIPCDFEQIQVENICAEHGKESHFLKVKKNNLWGYFNWDGKQIIDCNYDTLLAHEKSGYIEGGRNGYYLLDEEYSINKYHRIYNGKYDLYTINGEFIIGGYDSMTSDFQYFKIYFGTYYEHYTTKEWTIYNDEIELSHYRINYEDAICLLLDKKFEFFLYKDIEKNIHRGIVFNSKNEVLQIIPHHLILYNKITIWTPFIFSSFLNGEKYVITTPQISEEEYEQLYDEAFENHKKSIIAHRYLQKALKGTGIEQMDIEEHFVFNINFQDFFIEDDLINVIKVSEEHNHHIVWQYIVNEIGHTEDNILLYRKGEKCGFLTKFGLSPAIYSAISIDYNDGKIYVALINIGDRNYKKTNNPNYIHARNYAIAYYELLYDGSLIKQQDNWKIFNPTEHQWFPKKFIDEHQIKKESYPCRYEEFSNGQDWTDEDSWDALTDGMYGEMPRDPQTYDAMMDAMGF